MGKVAVLRLIIYGQLNALGVITISHYEFYPNDKDTLNIGYINSFYEHKDTINIQFWEMRIQNFKIQL